LAPPQDAAARQREIDRIREQERRRRQAMANRIDITEQMDLMANFEQTF
jgi:bromodomain-containing protein 4